MKPHQHLLNFFLILSATIPAAAETELRGTPTDLATHLAALPQIVGVTGESEVKVTADKAEITLKVSTEHRALVDALKSNQEIRIRVASYLKENGLGPDQIQAARFSSTQKYGIFSEKAKSHRVDNFLKVTVRDEKEFQAVAGTVDRWAEVQFLGIEMQHSNKEALKDKARAQALDKAGERRKLFEEKLGVKLVPKRFIDFTAEPVGGDRRASYYGARYSSGPGLDKVTTTPGRGGLAEGSEDSGSPFGELIFTARITVDYAVEPK